MRRAAITFCHGINNGPKDRSILRDIIVHNLSKSGILETFRRPGTEDHYVAVAEWESVGDFFMDIAALSKKEWCDNAVKSIADKFLAVQEQLITDSTSSNGELVPVHVVVMHSMGSPLGISALADLTAKGLITIPTIALTVGSPLGNRNAAFKNYLQWCTKRISWYKPSSSLKVVEWLDIWNPDDPICCDPLMNRLSSGYTPVRGVTRSLKFEWPGKPPVSNPLIEHSSYFQGSLLYSTVTDCIKAAPTSC